MTVETLKLASRSKLEAFLNNAAADPTPEQIEKLANDYADLIKHSEILVDSMFNNNRRKTTNQHLIQSYHNILGHIKRGSE